MCVGIPGQIVEIVDAATDTAIVEIGGVRRPVNVACILDDDRDHAGCVGEWVLVHVGFAMSRIDEAAALRTLELLRALDGMREATPVEARPDAPAPRATAGDDAGGGR